jgi:hypothetical protein
MQKLTGILLPGYDLSLIPTTRNLEVNWTSQLKNLGYGGELKPQGLWSG